jgi:hypothetical protein
MYPGSTPAEWLFPQEKAALKTIERARLLWFRSKTKVCIGDYADLGCAK